MRAIKITLAVFFSGCIGLLSAIMIPSEVEHEEVIDLRIEYLYENNL